ncbi:MAG TPA: Xaa-Pro peptidase family protein [Ktedonobacteraceae bacterium]|nr:Xaa-Pro peptidase family protein [Ktedonobacteraceae bacterium]
MLTNKQSDTLYPRFSQAEFSHRYATVRTIMQDAKLAALVVYGAICSQEILYFSDFEVTREAMLVFPAEGDLTLFIQMYNHVPNARRAASINDIRWGGPDTAAEVAANIQERGLAEQKIGIVGMIPVQRYETLKKALPHAKLVDFTRQIQQLRLVKSAEELAFLRKGAELSDRAIEALEHQVRPGITEHQLAAIVEGSYLGLGGKNSIHYMATTPMDHPEICVPAQHLSSRTIEKGDILITEISAQYHGYPGQILRPFTIGTPPTAAYQHMYDVAVEAFHRIASVIRAGATTDEVLDAAEYIHNAGFTIYDDLVHSLGGGYLPPILHTRRTDARPAQPFTFKENMTIVIQPNIITEDEHMGLQVGELVQVTPNGVTSLHRYPMRFIQCGTGR